MKNVAFAIGALVLLVGIGLLMRLGGNGEQVDPLSGPLGAPAPKQSVASSGPSGTFSSKPRGWVTNKNAKSKASKSDAEKMSDEDWSRVKGLFERAESGEQLTVEELRQLHQLMSAKLGFGGDKGVASDKELIARFDLDGDGKLSPSERAAMEEERMARLRGIRADLEDRFGGAIPVADSELEMFAKAVEDVREQAVGDVIEQEKLTFADLDGDGEISNEEGRAGFETFSQASDLDGDGEVSADEMKSMSEEWMRDVFERREGDMNAAFDAALIARYDVDADGSLNDAERAVLARELGAELMTYAMVGVVDVTGDGTMDENERAFYLERFEERDATADINFDGVVDQTDLEAFNRLLQSR